MTTLLNRLNSFRFVPMAIRIRTFSSAEPSQPVPHVPVMLEEVIAALKPEPRKTYIDMTFGAGGHTRRILQSAPDIKVIALDRDPDALQYAHQLADEYPNQITPLLGRFSDLPKLLRSIEVPAASIDGILFDFGCSSMQFDRGDRGFSVNKNGPLDMRMDRDPNTPTASDVIAKINEIDLYKVIKVYGEEKKAKQIARAICDVRYSFKRIDTTRELAKIVASCFDEYFHMDSLDRPMHNATKTFQAIRIFVNDELNEINHGIHLAEKYLKTNGRLVTLTFHSLEDTIVKRHINGDVIGGKVNTVPLKFVSHFMATDKEVLDEVMDSKWESIYKHVLTPSYDEVERNPRCRSAKLRAAIKKTQPVNESETKKKIDTTLSYESCLF